MEGKFLINMKDGRFVFRNAETDTHVNLKPVPNSVVDMVMSGEITEQDVINAISAKIKESGDFNLEEYIRELKKLNVRTSNPQESANVEKLGDRSEEEISVDEILVARKKSSDSSEKAARKARVKKAADAIEREEDLSGM